ncbi:hypothetical protein BMS3Abin17_00052 [archaeon BMS3Abin17]|nr:hypothetical protein BMS3Abin17_00052 [archaeon BMS3Abin17]
MIKTKEEKLEYHRNWRKNNKDKVEAADKKFRKSDKRKKYLREYSKTEKAKSYKKKWEGENIEKRREYDRRHRKKNPERVNANYKKYYYTPKGTATMLRKHDARRLGIKKSKLTWQIIEMINNRDKVCVYCGCELNGNVEYDHINSFAPFCKSNIVRACKKCNKEKSSADMIQWMKFKGYKISEKLQNLYKKAYE